MSKFIPIYILGINPSHNCSAVLLKNGEIIGSVSEERFTRQKNQIGFPEKSILYLLGSEGILPNQLAKLVIGFSDPKTIMKLFERGELPKEISKNYDQKKYYENIFKYPTLKYLRREIFEAIIYKNPSLGKKNLKVFVKKLVSRNHREVNKYISQKLNIDAGKIFLLDHHKAHAYSSLAFIDDNKSWSVITIDGEGDGFSGSISVYSNGRFSNISRTKDNDSLGLLYGYTTHFLGMKRNEHEYKVMGLAPYAKLEHYEELLPIFRKYLKFDKKNLTFRAAFDIHNILIFMRRDLASKRFDNISAALQKHTESLVVNTVKTVINKTKIPNLAMAGGVIMNVKANRELAALPEVKDVQFVPSATDESVAWGAAFWGYKTINPKLKIKKINSLYLGPEFSEGEILKAFKQFQHRHKLKIQKHVSLLQLVAKLLADGNVVAWFQGRMEWGARALGNRSILANPSILEITRIINKQIKNRDFWMPFSPSILDRYFDKYLIVNKKVDANYMMVAFGTTDLGKKHLAAAIHPADFSARPQIVIKDVNKKYYNLISRFEKITGIGALLNTSFNIHGEPIVCSPYDAFSTLVRSGLKYLAIGNFLVVKQT